MVRRSTGRSNMTIETQRWRGWVTAIVLRILSSILFGMSSSAFLWAAEAPSMDPGLPIATATQEAEAAYQIVDGSSPERWLDEAVFTEISPLIIPDVGVALPEDQQE